MNEMRLLNDDQYRILFEHLAEEVHFWQIVRDETGRIKTWRLIYVNPPTLKTWGHTSLDEIVGKTPDDIFGPGATEHYLPVVEKIIAERRPHSFQDYFSHLDKYFRFTSVPYGDYFITTGADITDFVKEQASLLSDNQRLEQRVSERTAELEDNVAKLRYALEEGNGCAKSCANKPFAILSLIYLIVGFWKNSSSMRSTAPGDLNTKWGSSCSMLTISRKSTMASVMKRVIRSYVK